MMGNYHVQFLGGKGAAMLLTYPVPFNKKVKDDFFWDIPEVKKVHISHILNIKASMVYVIKTS